MNEQLSEYYSYFEDNVPGVAPGRGACCRAWAQHHYELAPSHGRSYYAELAAQIIKAALA